MIAFLAAALLQEPGLWDGFEPGSWTRMSWGSLRSTAPAAEMRLERDVDGLLESYQSQSPRLHDLPRRTALLEGFRETARRRAPLRIKGRELACEVLEFAPSAGAPALLTLWRAKDVAVPPREMCLRGATRSLPVDVVALTYDYGPLAWSRELLDLDAPMEVAGRRLSCVVERGSSVYVNGARGCRRDFTQWLSAEVPGSLVQKDRDCTGQPDRPPHMYTMRDRLQDFGVVR